MTIRSRLEAGAVRASRVLIARACRPLPDAERDERYREWVAELPAIPGCHRFWPAGLLAMLLFSADQSRTTRPARRLARQAAWRDLLLHHPSLVGGVTGAVSVVVAAVVAAVGGIVAGIVAGIVVATAVFIGFVVAGFRYVMRARVLPGNGGGAGEPPARQTVKGVS